MAEKVTSMRLNEEDLEQFKAFAKENNLNQQQAFNNLIALAELEKAKDVLGDRAKSVNSFKETVTKLINFYVNALEENATTEETIREELNKELTTKDNTITTMYDQLQEIKNENKELDRTNNNYKLSDDILREEIKKLNNDIADKQKNIDKLNSNNDLLQENLQEYKQYKDDYKNLENELDQLKVEHQALKYNNDKLNNDNKQLHDKLNNNTDMITFYKSEIDNKDKSINEYKADIKSLEDTHKQQVLDVKDLYKGTLDNKSKEFQEQLKKSELEFNKKLDFELQKKDLEFQKLKNEIDALKKSNLKVPTTKTK